MNTIKISLANHRASAAGATGPQGPQGPAGATGDTGATGPQGERGFGVPQQGNISIGYAQFQPSYETTSYSYSTVPGYGLLNRDTDTRNFVAPVQLPHGTKIVRVTFFFADKRAL